MFNKLKAKLRLKLRLFLGISDLEESFIKYRQSNNKDIFNHEMNLKWCGEQFKSHENKFEIQNDKIEALHSTIQSVVSIGTDVTTHYDKNGSWAVVCIEGKYNVVKFVDLRGQYGRDILQFLKQFEASRYVIDAPMSFFSKDMFIDWNK